MITAILQILTAIGMVLFIVSLLRELLFPGFGENEKEKEDEGKKEIRHYTPAEKMAEDYKISQCYICRNDYRSCPYFEAVTDKINDNIAKNRLCYQGNALDTRQFLA